MIHYELSFQWEEKTFSLPMVMKLYSEMKEKSILGEFDVSEG